MPPGTSGYPQSPLLGPGCRVAQPSRSFVCVFILFLMFYYIVGYAVHTGYPPVKINCLRRGRGDRYATCNFRKLAKALLRRSPTAIEITGEQETKSCVTRGYTRGKILFEQYPNSNNREPMILMNKYIFYFPQADTCSARYRRWR